MRFRTQQPLINRYLVTPTKVFFVMRQLFTLRASMACTFLFINSLSLLILLSFSSVAFAIDEVSGPYQPYKPPVAPTKPAGEALKETGSKIKDFFK
jgi:hypothetical protein